MQDVLIYPGGGIVDGQPDFGNSLKIGSVARSALPVAATAGARIPILVDTFGRVIVASIGGGGLQVMGDIAHDDADLLTSFPVGVGGHANAALPASVSENDRVRWSFTLDGQGRVVAAGNVAHDAVDSGNPVKIGFRAVDPTALPAAVATNDRSDGYSSLQGETLVYLSRLLSGEDQTNNLIGTSNKKVATGTYSPSIFLQLGTFGASGEAQVKAAAGIVSSAYAHNKSGSDRFLYLKSKGSAIAGGDTPTVAPILVPAGVAVIVGEDFFAMAGMFFATQIRVGWSSTENTFTAVNEDVVVQVTYV